MAISNIVAQHAMQRMALLVTRMDDVLGRASWRFVRKKTVAKWREELVTVYNAMIQDHQQSAPGARPHPCHDQYCYNDEPHACHKEGCS